MTTDRSHNQLEIEVKLKCGDAEMDQLPGRLRELGFTQSEEETFESNVVFDTPDQSLKGRNMLLRLRRTGGRVILTMKRPVRKEMNSEEYKIREEIETEVADFEKARTIITGLGYGEFFIYEKFRSVYHKRGDKDSASVMLDRTPIGCFIEIEAPADKIDAVARQLGYSKKDYITANYYKLFRKEHATGHMLFT